MDVQLHVLLLFLVQCGASVHSSSDSQIHSYEAIWKWWAQMSDQKPVKCSAAIPEQPLADDPRWDWNKPSHILTCNLCPDDLKPPTNYTLKGELKFDDNGRCFGGGKLSFHKAKPQLKPENSVCLNAMPSLDAAVGSIKNGLLDGHVKLHFKTGSVVISTITKGLSSGLTRQWKSAGELQILSENYHGQSFGYCWRRYNSNYLVRYECQPFVQHNEADPKALFIHPTIPEEVFTGTYHMSHRLAKNLRRVKLTRFHVQPQECQPVIFYEEETKLLPFYVNLKTSDKIWPDKAVDSCKERLRGQPSASQVLDEWLNGGDFNGFLNQKSDELEKSFDPDKSFALIRNVSFHSRLGSAVMNGMNVSIMADRLTLDDDNLCHGRCSFYINANVTFDHTLNLRPSKIEGNFDHGSPEGPIRIVLQDKRNFYGRVKQGVLHGPAFLNLTAPILQIRMMTRFTVANGVGLLGTYLNGRLQGPVWIGMHGKGFLHGVIDNPDSHFTGDSLAYIYPDLSTSLIGKFEKLEMKAAQEAEVVSVECHSSGMLVVSKFSQPSGPVFYYGPPTNVSFGSGPDGVMDPYEKKYMKLAPSTLEGAGQGVFAIKDFPARRMLVLYSGFVYDNHVNLPLYHSRCANNVSQSVDYRRHCWKYALGIQSLDSTINIPPEFDGPDAFQPTLGPKVNHHFTKNCTEFGEFEHPRWGMIMSYGTLRPIKAGEELFSFYYYTRGKFPVDYPWYWKAKAKIEAEAKSQKLQKPKRRSSRGVGVGQ